MSAFQDIKLGFRTYGKAFGFVFQHNLWWAFFIPFAINIILFITGFEITDYISESIKNYLLNATDLNNADFFLSGALKTAISWVVGVSFSIIFFFLYTYYGGYITLILMSPLLAYLSERTEEISTGNKYPFNGEQFMRDIVRGVAIALRNMFIETGYIILFFILGIVPFIGWFFALISAIILFFVSSYFYGFSFLDYSNERKKLKIKTSVLLIRKHKWLAITNGSIFSLTLVLPFCGLFVSGFFAIISVVAASLAMTEVYKNNNI
jgi:CysZ protein